MTEASRDARVTCYVALSECFKEPEPAFVAQVLDGTLCEVIGRAFVACGLGKDVEPPPWPSTSDLAEAAGHFVDAYYALFKGPFPPYVVPVESAYRAWAETPLAGEAGRGRDMIMGDPAIEMLKRYKADGIAIPESFNPYPDHVALLLEYAGLLLQRGAPGVYAEFVARHLPWVTELRRDIFETTDNPFYRWAADLLCRFAACELDRADMRRPINRSNAAALAR